MAGRLATVSRDWEDRIRTYVENNPRAGGRRIAKQLEAEYPNETPPSPRTIDRTIERHRDPQNAAQRIDYRYVYWPESFDRGDLRWEAAPVFFELMRWNHHLSPPWPLTSGQIADVDDPQWEDVAPARQSGGVRVHHHPPDCTDGQVAAYRDAGGAREPVRLALRDGQPPSSGRRAGTG